MLTSSHNTNPDHQPSLFDLLGGLPGCKKLASAFYGRVAQDPVLSPIFPKSFHCAIDSLAAFLAQLSGGPNEYSQSRWWLSLDEAHHRFKIGRAERDAWLNVMFLALDDMKIGEPARSALREFFAESSASFINYPKGAEDAPVSAPFATECPDDPGASRTSRELAERWGIHRACEEIVACVRRGETGQAIALASDLALRDALTRDRAAHVSLIAVMLEGGGGELMGFVRQRLLDEPDLVAERHRAGRTLLHDAAEMGRFACVELLLGLGADPNATDLAGHAPLYCAGNGAGDAEIVRALARAGAAVDANGGVKRCTALHMAARRGNVPVAEALLDCGAALEARDSNGETPLRRAVNCAKTEMAAFLLSRGADVHAIGAKGLTPLEAARSEAMKGILRPYARE